MRKIILKVLTTLFIFSLLLTNLSGFSKVKAISSESKTVNVSVDPRIELLSVVQLLSDYDLINNFDFPYKKEMLEYFSPYKSHPAVTKFKEMMKEGFDYDAPVDAMLYLTNPPELKNKIPFTNDYYILDRAGGKENLESFIEALRDFAIKSNFMEFFNTHKEYYDKVVNEAKKILGNCIDASNLENFYGNTSYNSFNLILTFLDTHGYGPRIEIEPSKFDAYAIIGSADLSYTPGVTPEDFKYVVLHEFSHSFVNPLTEKFGDEVDRFLRLIKPIKLFMRREDRRWFKVLCGEAYISEVVTRAASAKLTEKLVSIEEAEKQLSKYSGMTYTLTRGVYNIIDKYDKNRDKYPTFSDIYPEILNYFYRAAKILISITIFIVIFIVITIGLLIFSRIRRRKK